MLELRLLLLRFVESLIYYYQIGRKKVETKRSTSGDHQKAKEMDKKVRTARFFFTLAYH